jgi:transposase
MTSASDTDIIKTDSRGRVRTPARRREQLLQEFASSGVSAHKFAQLAGIHYQTFSGWLKRRKTKLAPPAPTPGAKPPPDRVQWLEAVIEKRASATDSNTQALVRLQLEPGVIVEYHSPNQIPLIVGLLRALSKETPAC